MVSYHRGRQNRGDTCSIFHCTVINLVIFVSSGVPVRLSHVFEKCAPLFECFHRPWLACDFFKNPVIRNCCFYLSFENFLKFFTTVDVDIVVVWRNRLWQWQSIAANGVGRSTKSRTCEHHNGLSTDANKNRNRTKWRSPQSLW